MKTYPLGDYATGAELAAANADRHNVRALATGEKRSPKAGEWYLSGAIVAAYRAANSLTTVYQIARLVQTKTETITTVVE